MHLSKRKAALSWIRPVGLCKRDSAFSIGGFTPYDPVTLKTFMAEYDEPNEERLRDLVQQGTLRRGRTMR